MTDNLLCWNCGTSLDDIPRPISRHSNCSKCFEVLHCCRMCRHFEPEKRPYCSHDRAEPPVEKENANFCDYFRPVNRFVPADVTKSDQAKSELDALFGDSPGAGEPDVDIDIDEADADAALNKLNNLFDD